MTRIEGIEIDSYTIISSAYSHQGWTCLVLLDVAFGQLGAKLTEHNGNVYREENRIQQVTLTRED